MSLREEMVGGKMGLQMGLMGFSDQDLEVLARTVTERGEPMWLRFRAWQKDGHDNEDFRVWVIAMIAMTPVRPRSQRDGFGRDSRLPHQQRTIPPRGVNETLKSNVLRILQGATDKGLAKESIKKAVKGALSPRPRSCSVTVSWSSNPSSRSVYIHPDGHEAFTVSARS
ncbi:MAG: hypothetical protein HQ488_01055 [Parcubacteria group bacterium]|nr:hypothetical protein [Parcubacteria group bacterium]